MKRIGTKQRSAKKADALIQGINHQIWRLISIKEILEGSPQPLDKRLDSGRRIIEIRKGKDTLYKLVLLPRRGQARSQGYNGPYWYADCGRLHTRSKYVCSAKALERLRQNAKLMAFAFDTL